jgi:hypothetical protein
MSAAQIRTADASKAGSFCFGMFSADYHKVEKWVQVSDGDIRHRDAIGDAWVAMNPSRLSQAPRVAADRTLGRVAGFSGRWCNLRGQALPPQLGGSGVYLAPAAGNDQWTDQTFTSVVIHK